MNDPFHERAGAILLEALAQPRDERSAYVEHACGSDAVLLAEVQSLLAASEESLSLVDAPGESLLLGSAQDDREDRLVGCTVGPYRVKRRIASGGMGVVYEAEQEYPRRIVALKVLRREITSPSALRRFQFEVQALAQLRHAGIAQIHHAGVHEEGGVSTPYFAMEYVADGKSITAFSQAQRLSRKSLLALFASVCDAVHHGHQQGIIHRDLKPDNVLVDASGQPKVIDFGVARAAEGDMPLTTRHTSVAQLIGTLPYMSPEQLSGDSAAVDIRTDVYSLGVILYQLLADRLPAEIGSRSLLDAVHTMRNVEPTKLGSFDRSLRGDLETIVAMALEKDKSRRYQSAAEFAADIRRYLRNEPISARPPTTMYQLRKFAHRHRGLVAGGLVAVVALLLGTVVSIQQAYVATRARDVAREQETRAKHEAYLASVSAAAAALQTHDIRLARRSLERAPADLRGWEWRHLYSRLDQSVVVIPGGSRPSGRRIRFLDSDVIGTWDDATATWRRWSVRDGSQLGDVEADPYFERSRYGDGAFSVEGGLVTFRDGAAQTTGSLELTAYDIPLSSMWRTLALSDNARYFAFNSTSRATLIDRETGVAHAISFNSQPSGGTESALSDAPQMAFATALQGKPATWDPPALQLRPLAGAAAPGRCVAYNPTGDNVLVGMTDGTLGLWQSQTGQLLSVGRGHHNAVSDVAFSPDGKLAVSVSDDRTIRIWNAATLAPLYTLHGHDSGIDGVRFADDGKHILTIGTGKDAAVRVWDISSPAGFDVLEGHESYVYPVAFSPDGRTIASGSWDNTIRLWDADSRGPLRCLLGCTSHLTELVFSPNGRRLVSASGDDTLRMWDANTGRQLGQLNGQEHNRGLTFCRDGDCVYLPGSQELWEADSGKLLENQLSKLDACPGGAVSSDGRYAVSCSENGCQLLRTIDGRPALPEPIGEVYAFAPPNTRQLLAAIDPDAPCSVQVWYLGANEPIASLRGHTGRSVYDIAFSPDGTRIATAGDDQVIRIWDTATFEEIVSLTGHRAYVWSVAFSPDGTQLVSGSGDGTVRIWDTISRAERRRARGNQTDVNDPPSTP